LRVEVLVVDRIDAVLVVTILLKWGRPLWLGIGACVGVDPSRTLCARATSGGSAIASVLVSVDAEELFRCARARAFSVALERMLLTLAPSSGVSLESGRSPSVSNCARTWAATLARVRDPVGVGVLWFRIRVGAPVLRDIDRIEAASPLARELAPEPTISRPPVPMDLDNTLARRECTESVSESASARMRDGRRAREICVEWCERRVPPCEWDGGERRSSAPISTSVENVPVVNPTHMNDLGVNQRKLVHTLRNFF